MNPSELKQYGVPKNALKTAIKCLQEASGKKWTKAQITEGILNAINNKTKSSSPFRPLDRFMMSYKPEKYIRDVPVPFKIWGKDNIEDGALSQMINACMLPISVRGTLMPDAHQGYGLPIGGVLATDNAVIPYAVGVN